MKNILKGLLAIYLLLGICIVCLLPIACMALLIVYVSPWLAFLTLITLPLTIILVGLFVKWDKSIVIIEWLENMFEKE